MKNRPTLKATLLTAATAIVCAALQFAASGSLAAPRNSAAEPQGVVQLPKVLVRAQLEAVQQLPRVLVVAHRSDRDGRVTAQARAAQRAI